MMSNWKFGDVMQWVRQWKAEKGHQIVELTDKLTCMYQPKFQF